MKTLVLLDFCGTVINFQTFDPYVKKVILAYYPERERWIDNKMLRFISRVLNRFNRDYYFYKHYLVRLTSGIPEAVFRETAIQYCQGLLCPNLIRETENLIKKFKKEGCTIIVLSGGCDLYIKEFLRDYHIEKIIATEISFRNGKSTGKIVSDCLGRKKLKMLKELLGESLEKYNVVGITDSQTDLPMLSICRKKIIISHNQHQNWVSEDMDEIIWSKN